MGSIGRALSCLLACVYVGCVPTSADVALTSCGAYEEFEACVLLESTAPLFPSEDSTALYVPPTHVAIVHFELSELWMSLYGEDVSDCLDEAALYVPVDLESFAYYCTTGSVDAARNLMGCWWPNQQFNFEVSHEFTSVIRYDHYRPAGIQRTAEAYLSVFAHEALHQVLHCARGNSDGDHVDPLWDTIPETVATNSYIHIYGL